MPSLTVIADMPDTILSTGEVRSSEVQIAKTGKFSDPRYGNFAITMSDFSRWLTNFTKIHKAEGRVGLPVDVDHGPEMRGNTEAAGWITDLKVKNGTELWATVEWNDLGVELVESKRYRYLSPSYVHNYKDETGKQHGTTLVGVGLTNRPFLTMAAVSLSANLGFAQEVEPYSQTRMPDFTNIAQALKLSDDADEATILSAIQEAQKEPVKPVSLADQAQSEGQRLVPEADYTKLLADATAGAAAAVQLSTMKFDTAFDKALSEGRAVPAMKENMSELHKVNPDLALKMLSELPQMVSVTPTGAGGGAEDGETLSADLAADAAGFSVDADRVQLHAKAEKLMTLHSIDYAAAVEMAAMEMGA